MRGDQFNNELQNAKDDPLVQFLHGLVDFLPEKEELSTQELRLKRVAP